MTREILIIVEGGVVHEMYGIPEGMTVRIKDYDVDGCSESEVLRDRDGERYRQIVWTHEDSCGPANP